MTYSDREFGASQSDYEPKEQQMSDIVERNMVARPYSADEERVVKYIVDLTDIGGGPDPIGFLIASHNALVERLRAGRAAVVEECRQAAETAARKWPHAANDVVAAIAALKGGAA
jgi:hypothetical protein